MTDTAEIKEPEIIIETDNKPSKKSKTMETPVVSKRNYENAAKAREMKAFYATQRDVVQNEMNKNFKFILHRLTTLDDKVNNLAAMEFVPPTPKRKYLFEHDDVEEKKEKKKQKTVEAPSTLQVIKSGILQTIAATTVVFALKFTYNFLKPSRTTRDGDDINFAHGSF